MPCRRIQEKFTELADGTLPAADATELQAHLSSCPACAREWQNWRLFTAQVDSLAASPAPSPRLRENFYAMLESAEAISPTANPFSPPRSRLAQFFTSLLPTQPALQFAAAAAVFAVGLFLGHSRLLPSKPFSSPANPPIAKSDPSAASAKDELEALRAEVNSMGRLVSSSLLQQRSTNERLRAVLALRHQPQLDRPVVMDLISTLALDPSVNVRLTTLDTLSLHGGDPLVRAGIAAALAREPAPLVQLAMIDLLADAADPAARPVFETLSRDPAADANVRAAAQDALLSLGQGSSRQPNPSSPPL